MPHIYSAPSHWCCDERPCSGTVPYTEGPALIQTALRTPQATHLEHNQDATSELSHHCTVSDCSLITNVNSPKIADPFSYQGTVSQTRNSIQTYINHHKTHAMATHYGGVGDTSMENPETQDLDNDSQDNFHNEKYCSTINL